MRSGESIGVGVIDMEMKRTRIVVILGTTSLNVGRERTSTLSRLANCQRIFSSHNLIDRPGSDKFVEEALVYLAVQCCILNSTFVMSGIANVHYLRVGSRSRTVDLLRNISVEQFSDKIRAYRCFSDCCGEYCRIIVAERLRIL